MRISKEKYAMQRGAIKLWLETKKFDHIGKEISYIAISTGCPVIIVVEFVMEIQGRTTELLSLQQRLMDFYHIKEVV